MDAAVATSATSSTDFGSKKSFRVVLFGDSLINVPCEEFGLQMQIKSQFPEYDLEVINAGINSDRIANMRARTDRDVLSLKPDAVIVFWDSDVSDQSIEVLDRTETKIRYEEDLRAVLQNLKANCPHLSVSGPGLLGEGPLFVPRRFQGKNRLLDAYREINKQVCQSLDSILYIDLRQALQDGLPSVWLFNRWYLTSDGEHPNERGTQILAKKFGEVISTWLKN